MQRRREEKKKELAESELKNLEEFKSFRSNNMATTGEGQKRKANIMLIGDGYPGKTSLINAYAGKGF